MQQAEEFWNDTPTLSSCLTFHPQKRTEQGEADGAGNAKRQTIKGGVRWSEKSGDPLVVLGRLSSCQKARLWIHEACPPTALTSHLRSPHNLGHAHFQGIWQNSLWSLSKQGERRRGLEASVSVCLLLYVTNLQIVINTKEADKKPGDRECGETWATEAAGVSGSAHRVCSALGMARPLPHERDGDRGTHCSLSFQLDLSHGNIVPRARVVDQSKIRCCEFKS